MHRLFVAVEPPMIIRDALLAGMGGVAGARWQRDDQLHLTLRFIGEVDRHAGADITAALGAVHHPGFDLTLTDAGVFDRRGRVGSLWIGVAPYPPVAALHHKVDAALLRVGVPPDARAYRPHITIARFGREQAGAAAFVPLVPLVGTAFRVDQFALYESSLGHDGADYRVCERYTLD